MKFVGLAEFEIWTIVWRKVKWRHNFIFIKNSNTKLPRAYLSDIQHFISIGNKRAEIQGREVNYEERNEYQVTVTLTLNPRSPISIGFEPVCKATV